MVTSGRENNMEPLCFDMFVFLDSVSFNFQRMYSIFPAYVYYFKYSVMIVDYLGTTTKKGALLNF